MKDYEALKIEYRDRAAEMAKNILNPMGAEEIVLGVVHDGFPVRLKYSFEELFPQQMLEKVREKSRVADEARSAALNREFAGIVVEEEKSRSKEEIEAEVRARML